MTIYTHSGIFHADDVFCVAAIRIGGFGTEVKRVRELPKKFSPETDIAIDVGGEFDPTKMIFDHHQKNGNNDEMAAIGKFWSVYGSHICSSQEVADRVYLTLIGSIDRADIGVADWAPIKEEWRHCSASNMISMMNPADFSKSDSYFEAATQAADLILRGAIENAEKFVGMEKILDEAQRPFSEVLILDQAGPWQENVLSNSEYDKVLYVIFPSDRGGFQIQCVPDELGSFSTRKSIPYRISGMRGEELMNFMTNISGVKFTNDSSLFIHPAGFIGGALTIEETLAIANFAILS
jgi:uncharacterized UPF0160 family protein